MKWKWWLEYQQVPIAEVGKMPFRQRNKSKGTDTRESTTFVLWSTGYKIILIGESGKANWAQIVIILLNCSKKLGFQTIENWDLLKIWFKERMIIYEFKKQLLAGKGTQGRSLVESTALVQRAEHSRKGGRAQPNGYFRAGINTLLYFGKVRYVLSEWFFQVSVTLVKIKFGDKNISFMGK